MHLGAGSWKLLTGAGLALLMAGAMIATPVPPPSEAGFISPSPLRSPIRAVRFDAGYYYGTGLSVDSLVERLVTHWDEQGVNTIYYYAYSFAYGARYRTRYRLNAQEDFGRLDLLRKMLDAAHRRNMKVIAWVYVLRHKGAWDARPEWRTTRADGRPYADGFDMYFLSAHQPGAVEWWLGFIDELLAAYPDLDGIDFAEPVVNWWGNLADHSDAARAAFRASYPLAAVGGPSWQRFRADTLSAVLEASIQVVRRHRREVHVTMPLPARASGALIAPRALALATGFDLDRILSVPARPDYVNVELIFQQWAAAHASPDVFTPEWTASAAEAARRLIGGRAKLIVHVELSEFGGVVPSVPQLGRVLRALRTAGVENLDLYAAHLIDAVGAWDVVRAAYAPRVASTP